MKVSFNGRFEHARELLKNFETRKGLAEDFDTFTGTIEALFPVIRYASFIGTVPFKLSSFLRGAYEVIQPPSASFMIHERRRGGVNLIIHPFYQRVISSYPTVVQSFARLIVKPKGHGFMYRIENDGRTVVRIPRDEIQHFVPFPDFHYEWMRFSILNEKEKEKCLLAIEYYVQTREEGPVCSVHITENKRWFVRGVALGQTIANLLPHWHVRYMNYRSKDGWKVLNEGWTAERTAPDEKEVHYVRAMS